MPGPSARERLVRLATGRSWLSVGMRHRLMAAACPPRPTAFETVVFGCRYAGRLDSYIDREVFFLGAYEPAVLDLLARLGRQRERPVLLDIGANVGQHCLFAAKHYAEIHAFEPYPPLVAVLREQIECNGFSHVHIHAVGLGDRDGDMLFAAPADSRAGYGGFDNADPNLHQQMLPMHRADTYLPSIGADRVDVIKIDVEGSERRVLEGLAATVERHLPALVVELWPEKWPQPIEAALPHGYRVWALDERGTVAGIFSRRKRALKSPSQVIGGSIVVALPKNWPVPPDYTVD